MAPPAKRVLTPEQLARAGLLYAHLLDLVESGIQRTVVNLEPSGRLKVSPIGRAVELAPLTNGAIITGVSG